VRGNRVSAWLWSPITAASNRGQG